jgi:hypothetical protein
MGGIGWYEWHEVTEMALNGVRCPLSIQWFTPMRCTPMRYTPMRHTPIRCTSVGYTPIRYLFMRCMLINLVLGAFFGFGVWWPFRAKTRNDGFLSTTGQAESGL